VKAKFLTVLFFFFLVSPVFSQDMLIMSVFLNEEPKGEEFGYITADGDVLISSGTITKYGLNVKGREIIVDGDNYISLRSLGPTVKFEFSEKDIALHITADPDALDVLTINLGASEAKDIYYPVDNSVFLNYSFNYMGSEDGGFTQLNVPLETGIHLHDYLFFSNFSYTNKEDGTEKFTRLLTNIVRDDRAAMTRYVLGDYTASTGELGGSAIIGGLTISKAFSLNPYFIRYPGLNLEGLIYTPSDVELWRDGTLIKRERMSPGKFKFMNVPAITGSGEAEIVIRDSYGAERRFIVPFYFSTRLLKKNVHEYTYSLGYKRNDFGNSDFDYGNEALLVTHRYGFTKAFTGGIRSEFSKGLANIGLSGSRSIASIGFIDAAAAYSFNDKDGQAFSIGYSNYLVKHKISWGATVRGHSRYYSNLTFAPEDDKPEVELVSNISFSPLKLGTLTLSYNLSDNYDSTDSRILSLRHTKKLTKKLGFDISVSTIHADSTENEIYLTLRYLFDNSTSGYATYRATEDEEKVSGTLQKSPAGRIGTNYRVLAENNNTATDESKRYDAELGYQGQYGVYTGRYFNNDNEGSYQLSASGSIAAVNGSVHFGQPVRDSFSIVKVDRLKDVEVYHSNTPIGTTDGNGEVMVPFMISYNDNVIMVDDEGIPMNYSLVKGERHISPMYRSGSYIEFGLVKIQSIIGTITVIDNGKGVPAEFWHMSFESGGKTVETSIVRDGEFYLENIPSGTYNIHIYKDKSECSFDMTIPESTEMMLDLGTLKCNMN